MPPLRDGWTTGTTATAAALAALEYSRTGWVPSLVKAPLPPGVAGPHVSVPIEGAGPLPGGIAWGTARKYAGDDPDVTDGMLIRVELYPEAPGEMIIDGGQGIGRVTLPGLPVPPGQAAINPAPRAQIAAALRGVAPELGFRAIVIAPEGESRARGTMNARLGIAGGISILGTQGIVRPFSNAAWKATLEQFAAVNLASGQEHVAFATGRRSQRLLERACPGLPAQAFMVAGDFVADALQAAAPFARISWGCFFGKLVKLAQGHANTHAHVSALDMEFLAKSTHVPRLAFLGTAQEALEYLLRERRSAIEDVAVMARDQAMRFAGKSVAIHLFHTDGRELASL